MIQNLQVISSAAQKCQCLIYQEEKSFLKKYLPKKNTPDISSLAAGMYLLQLKNENATLVFEVRHWAWWPSSEHVRFGQIVFAEHLLPNRTLLIKILNLSTLHLLYEKLIWKTILLCMLRETWNLICWQFSFGASAPGNLNLGK